VAEGSLRSIPVAAQFAEERLRGRFIFVPGLGWHRWNGWKWEDLGPDGELLIQKLAGRWAVDFLVRKAAEGVSGDVLKALARYREEGQNTTLARAARLADSIAVSANELDQDPWLLACPNGVVDLRTGVLSPPNPALYITRSTTVDYVPGFEHEDWSRALEAVPEDARLFLQDRYGQALTGFPTPSDQIVVCSGGGENGKTTLGGTCFQVAGDYARLLTDKVLLGSARDHSTDLMDLRGVRLAYLEETPEARRLDPVKLKRLLGVPVITARRIQKDPVSFRPTFTLLVNTNWTPVVTETDHGTWRRLVRVAFERTYYKTPEEVARHGEGALLADQGLRVRLSEGGSDGQKACLAWMVEGAVRFWERGQVLGALPPSVEAATLAWREESDVLLGYVSEFLDFDDDYYVLSSDLLTEVNRHLLDLGHQKLSDQTLATRFGGHSVFGRKVRKTQAVGGRKLSRPGWEAGLAPVPAGRPRAWIGARFRVLGGGDAGQADSDEEGL
jgi:P4 family phage/plasmid primase-like protien